MENNIVRALIKKGIKIPNPESVYISKDVNPDRISDENVTIYSGSKIFGKNTLVMKNSQIGYEAPVTLENTLVGENTRLNGGFFKNAVFAGDNTFGSGAHVRDGSILEEEANAAHTVGLKQTILFPFVTLGSLINFCDCLMAGGTSRKDHSEVGSSYIHFNYTPNQDKATPSMMGDIHQGVLLRSRPIFLGGQGGLVGPVRITYGCMTAAGSIIRKNTLKNDRLLCGSSFKEASIPRQPGVYTNVRHIFNNNVYYIAGLIALKSWYGYIRILFAYDDLSRELIKGMQACLNRCIEERMNRFEVFCDQLKRSRDILTSKKKGSHLDSISVHNHAIETSKSAIDCFQCAYENQTISSEGEHLIPLMEKQISRVGKRYISVIQSLETDPCERISQWLWEIEKEIVENLLI